MGQRIVKVLLDVDAGCIAGQEDASKRRIEAAVIASFPNVAWALGTDDHR